MIGKFDFAALLAMHWLIPNNKIVRTEVLKRLVYVDVGRYKHHILKPVVIAYIPSSIYDNMKMADYEANLDNMVIAPNEMEILLETYDGKILGIYDHQPDPKTKREFILSQGINRLVELSRYVGIDQQAIQAIKEEYELIKAV